VQILVPNIVGATRQAVDLKQLGTVWSRESFQEEAGHRSGAPVAAAFDRLFGHVESHGGRLSWSEGVTPGWPAGFRLSRENSQLIDQGMRIGHAWQHYATAQRPALRPRRCSVRPVCAAPRCKFGITDPARRRTAAQEKPARATPRARGPRRRGRRWHPRRAPPRCRS